MNEQQKQELASIQKLALAGEQGEVDPGQACTEIAQRLGLLWQQLSSQKQS